MAADIQISSTIGISEAGYNEEWLQNQIWENPASLGFGDLEGVVKEAAVSSGGRLDLLFKSVDDDIMYEVEVMLGETDPSHIIRTIEYWDLVRRKWPQRQHFGVLVAERITKRYFNVIHILSNNVPLVAVQANIIEAHGSRFLHFTKILDAYEEPTDDLSVTSEPIDEQFWVEKSNAVLKSARAVFEITKDIYEGASLTFNKTSITIRARGYNQIYFKKRSGNGIRISFRYGTKKDELESILQQSDISYEDKYTEFHFQVTESWISQHEEVFRQIAALNNRWWTSQP